MRVLLEETIKRLCWEMCCFFIDRCFIDKAGGVQENFIQRE